MFGKVIKDRNFLTIFISLFILVMVYVCSNFFYVLNKNIQNNYYAIKNVISGTSANPHIIVAKIDDKTLEQLWRFPFDRSVYATVLDNLKPYGVATVGLDLIFIDKTSDESDNAFAQWLQDSWNVVLGSVINEENVIEEPHPLFKNTSFLTGFLSPNIDPRNRTVYAFDPIRNIEWKLYEHFALRTLRAFYLHLYRKDHVRHIGDYRGNYYELLENIRMPLASSNSKDILINYVQTDDFEQISFADLYDPAALADIDKRIDIKDKIILVWTATDGIKDIFYTPNGIEYGVFIHANIINTVLTKRFLVYFDKGLEWTLIFLLIILSVYANLSRSHIVSGLSNILLVWVFLIFIPFSVLIFTNLVMNHPSEMIFGMILSVTVANLMKYLVESKSKTKLNNALSEYVGWDIASEILSWEWKVNLDGEKKDVVVFFSDIKNFTWISEKLTPEELVFFLREYLTKMSNIIMDERWFIDKYEWDSVMALWWVFWEVEDNDYVSACKSAIAQRDSLQQLSSELSHMLSEKISIRMWIHAWEVIVGNIWAKGRKMEFTALWDNVNLASRLEWVNKFYGTDICTSEVIYNKMKNDFVFRFIDTIRVKWRIEPVNIYELICETSKLSQHRKKVIADFDKAIELYKNRDFQGALDIFSILADAGDQPSLTYKSRCRIYLLKWPGKDWDGVWSMRSK